MLLGNKLDLGDDHMVDGEEIVAFAAGVRASVRWSISRVSSSVLFYLSNYVISMTQRLTLKRLRNLLEFLTCVRPFWARELRCN